MNFGSIGIQKTVDKIINNFCYTYDLDETEFRKELAQFTASKTSYIGDDNEDGEDGMEIMLEGLWSLIATKDKGYQFAILAGSMMAIAPPPPPLILLKIMRLIYSVSIVVCLILPNFCQPPTLILKRQLTQCLYILMRMSQGMVHLYR